MKNRSLKISNARENNLKNISLEIPHDCLTVLTGLSGSGKSSLAFETVYAEGQRRYIETFSPYTRQFFDKVKRPNVDLIENVRPAIAIQQRTRITGSRSTVGTLTNINDYLKLLWSNLAVPLCPSCGIVMEAWTPKTLAEHFVRIIKTRGRSQYLICAPITISKAAAPHEIERIKALGFCRFFNPKEKIIESTEDGATPTPANDGRYILVLERTKSSTPQAKRLQEAIEQAFALANGSCLLIELESAETTKRRPLLQVINSPDQENITPNNFNAMEFYASFRCISNKIKVEKARPSLFSFNHPLGACPECKGFGRILKIDRNLCIPNQSLSIEEKALQCWASQASAKELKRLLAFCKQHRIPTDIPWRDLASEQQEKIFNHRSKEYRGVNHWFKRLERKAYKMHVRVFLSKYRGQFICPSCNGARLKPAALAYQVKGKTLPDIWNMPVHELHEWLKTLGAELSQHKALPRQLNDVFEAILCRLQYLIDLGLSYLTLDRQARTLSGGETQRVNLTTALGSDLISTHFVLDEPSVGLHARDTRRLIESIRKLQASGNSLLVVEHDPDCIGAADFIVELGPSAGQNGGEVVYAGPRQKWHNFLSLQIDQKFLKETAPPKNKKTSSSILKIKNAGARNLKGIDIDIPLRKFVCLTGVSGSGKSTLVTEVIQKAWVDHQTRAPLQGDKNLVKGFEQLEQVLLVDQTPLAKSPRANIGTYSGIWDEVRKLLAGSDDAQTRALGASAFSFNVEAGRCPACKGAGFIREDMQFLSDVYIPCELCLGKRFQETILEVKYRGLNAYDFLQMSVDRSAEFFHNNPKIEPIATILSQLGLGHLTLGHPLSELSGGEAQRLKLVPYIEKGSQGEVLFIFDEPTTGLHIRDIEKLIELFRLLRDDGHSVLCVEHNLHLIAACDWIIDLGPEGGKYGGYLMKTGTPKEFIKEESTEKSFTAQYLRDALQRAASPQKAGTPIASVKRENALHIRGAREHNLKNINVNIPLESVVVVTGLSGSGKSTIAKDIIYAEGQRRYLDCLSPYARQYIKELKRPDIDSITNVKPTICVYQHTFQPSWLSTVATMSEIYNFLRLLYAKAGVQYCPDHPTQAISPLSSEEIAREIKKLKQSSVRILAPVIKMKKGNHRAVLQRAVDAGIGQIRIDGVFFAPGALRMEGGLERNKPHTIEFTVAKFNPAQVELELIQQAVTQSLALGAGSLIVHTGTAETIYSTERTCPTCKRGFFKPDPEDLSFNSKRGVCPECLGAGTAEDGSRCKECEGTRLNSIGRNIRIKGRNIHEACQLTPSELAQFLASAGFDSRAEKIAASVQSELLSKIRTLVSVGLDYIALNRDCSTLSGGELQRLRLATAMGSPLTGVLYIFDEPSAGLHPIDNRKILGRIRELKEQGNSVIMIEHDRDSILASDYVVEVGPGGGKRGGEITCSLPIEKFLAGDTVTAVALKDSLYTAMNGKPHKPKNFLRIKNGNKNNLHALNVELPLNELLCVAGVSGAGKSSLIHGIVCDGINFGAIKGKTWSYEGATLQSDLEIKRLLLVDQKPIGINSRSTPASYLGIWDEIRKLFATTIEAKSHGWKANFFSYNTGKGRCPDCKGQGQIKLEMSFLADATMLCERCGGSRYSDEANSITYQGLTISEILGLTFDEARLKFVNHRKIHLALHQACELGLGYLTLGQSSATLSGGESQRIKLVSELCAGRSDHTLYILDEPTTGLHKVDVARLIKILKDLVSRGNSVIVIEHDPDLILHSDYVIELGPGAGANGGKVIYSGAPSKLHNAKTPWGEYLREVSPLHAEQSISA